MSGRRRILVVHTRDVIARSRQQHCGGGKAWCHGRRGKQLAARVENVDAEVCRRVVFRHGQRANLGSVPHDRSR